MKSLIALSMCALLILCGCAVQKPAADDSGATPEGISSVVSANNRFAFGLYSELRNETPNSGKNLFFSPYSISSAAAVVYEGARGGTAQEMEAVFRFPQNDQVRRSSFASIYNSINGPNPRYQLSTANALWVEKTYALLPQFVNNSERFYGANSTNMDFIHDADNSALTINKWVEAQTNGKIANLIQPGKLDSLTRLVVTNAIYFKGTWVNQFDKWSTHEADFQVSQDRTVKVQMMHVDETGFNYTENDDLQALEMPYAGGSLSMLVLLPKGSISDLEASLNEAELASIRSSMHDAEPSVYFPKFKLDTSYDLGAGLGEMGMPSAFDPDAADFSGMDGSRNLSIQAVLHKAYIDVNEEGTEAAAATAITMGLGAGRPLVFNADRPFIFVIQQRDTGNILFMGRVMDPTG